MSADFQPVTTFKQWKQQVQFELQGADYNETLVFNTPEEVSILPLYTSENKHRYYNVQDKKTQPIISLNCFATESTIKKINSLEKYNYSAFFLNVHSNLEIEKLLSVLPKQHLYFINNEFITEEINAKLQKYVNQSSLRLVLCNDYIHRYTKKGKWIKSQSSDFEWFVKTISPQNPAVFVDTTLFQNAGASMVQQIAYGVAQAVEYAKYIEKNRIINELTIYFNIAVGSHFLLEIAKLRAFRQMATSVFGVFPFETKFVIMATVSDREMSLLQSEYNAQYIALGYESAVLGGADFVFPKYPIIYHKKKNFQQELASILALQHCLKNQSFFVNKNDCFQSLSYEFAKKSLLLFQNMEKKGGLFEMIKNHSLQKSIREKAQEEQRKFNESVSSKNINLQHIAPKSEWETYPFLKLNPTKTFVEPLIATRLWENLEKKQLNQ